MKVYLRMWFMLTNHRSSLEGRYRVLKGTHSVKGTKIYKMLPFGVAVSSRVQTFYLFYIFLSFWFP